MTCYHNVCSLKLLDVKLDKHRHNSEIKKKQSCRSTTLHTMGPLIIGLGKNMQSHLSTSDLFHLPCCASAPWFLLCVSRRGTHALVNETSWMGKKPHFCWLWVFHHCVSHIPVDHRRTETGCAEKLHSAVGLVRLFSPENTPSNEL